MSMKPADAEAMWEQADRNGGEVDFTIEAPAGRIILTGEIGGDRGRGFFTFTPNPAFESTMAEVGIEVDETDEDHLLAAEYSEQRPSCEYFLGIVEGIGIDLDIPNGSVTENKIELNAVTTGKIQDGTIQFNDIGPNGAGEGEIMKMIGGNWTASDDETGSGGTGDITSVTASTGLD